MLMITRKVGQSVVVGNSIIVKVLEISGGTVRLGFEAPAEVSLYREELYLLISEANRAAASGPPPADPGAGIIVERSAGLPGSGPHPDPAGSDSHPEREP